MARRPAQAAARKDDAIQIRASAETKALLDRAASLCGQKLSEFVLARARRRAEDAILDQHDFFLDAEAHRRFRAMLDTPTTRDAALRARMRRKPAWAR